MRSRPRFPWRLVPFSGQLLHEAGSSPAWVENRLGERISCHGQPRELPQVGPLAVAVAGLNEVAWELAR